MNNTNAALKAGYSPRNPSASAHQALKNIEPKAPELFGRHELDDDSFIEKHLIPALRATETLFFAHNGEVVSERKVKAWGIRMQAIELTARMKGMIVQEQERTPAQNIRVVILNANNRPPRPGTPSTAPPMDASPVELPDPRE